MTDQTTPKAPDPATVIRRRARAEFTWHAWLDHGEAWERDHIEPPEAVVKAATAQEAAVLAYDELNQVQGDRATIILKATDDPAVGTEKPFWIVEIEPRPSVRNVKAATLAELCDETNELIGAAS